MGEAAWWLAVELRAMGCASCSFVFWAPVGFCDDRRVHHAEKGWACPACGGWSVAGEDQRAKLRREVERLTGDRDFWKERSTNARQESERLGRRLSATRGVLTRVRKRVASGVCPVADCHRHFTNLARHMKGVHPGYVPAAEVG